MSTITTINATDQVSNSRSTINTNFSNLNTDKEEVSNKDTSTSLGTSDTKYPSQKAVKSYVDTGLSGKQATGSYEVTTNKETSALDTSTSKYPCNNVVKTAVDAKLTANVAISGATKTKITYDSKGLVTSGADATAADVGADATGTAASAVSGHAALTTGVHGVGAGTIAKTSDITATKLDDFATPDNNTDLNANTTNHGLLLQATAPASGLINVVGIGNGETAYANKALFDATAPSTQAFGDSAAAGTAVVAARRDHKHAMPASTKDTTAVTGILSGNGSVISAAANSVALAAVTGTNTGDQTLPVKCSGAEITTGTDDAKFVTPKALADATTGKLGAAWTAYSPSWTGLTLNNGTLVCRYAIIGKVAVYQGYLKWGNSTSASGKWIPSFPVGFYGTDGIEPVGTISMLDNSTGALQMGFMRGNYDFQTYNGAQITNTAPWTWATDDVIRWTITYEVA